MFDFALHEYSFHSAVPPKQKTQYFYTGYFWRHQIAVAPFILNAELNLLSVYIPHITPTIESFRVDDENRCLLAIRHI